MVLLRYAWCSYFPQSCLRRWRQHMRFSSVAHLHAGQTGLEPIHTVLYSHLILYWERGSAREISCLRQRSYSCMFPIDNPNQHSPSSTSESTLFHRRTLTAWKWETASKANCSPRSPNQAKRSPCFPSLSVGLFFEYVSHICKLLLQDWHRGYRGQVKYFRMLLSLEKIS